MENQIQAAQEKDREKRKERACEVLVWGSLVFLP